MQETKTYVFNPNDIKNSVQLEEIVRENGFYSGSLGPSSFEEPIKTILQKKLGDDAPEVNVNNLNLPTGYFVVGSNCHVSIEYKVSPEPVKAFLFARHDRHYIYIVVANDGKVYDVSEYMKRFFHQTVDVTPEPVSLSPKNSNHHNLKNFTSALLQDRLSETLTPSQLNKVLVPITSVVKKEMEKTFLRIPFQLLKENYLDKEVLKCCNRVHLYFSTFYNFLVENEYRKQFVNSYQLPRTFYMQLSRDFQQNVNKVFNNDLEEGVTFGGFADYEDYSQAINAIDEGYPARVVFEHAINERFTDKNVVKAFDYIVSKSPNRNRNCKDHTLENFMEMAKYLSAIRTNFWPVSRKDWESFCAFYEVVCRGNSGSMNFTSFLKYNPNEAFSYWGIGKNGFSLIKENIDGSVEEVKETLINVLDTANAIQDAAELLYGEEKGSSLVPLTKKSFTNLLKLNDLYHEISHVINNKTFTVLNQYWTEKGDIAKMVDVNSAPQFYLSDERKEFNNRSIDDIAEDYGVNIKQLRTTEDFSKEGNEMKHCVASYISVAKSARTIIFSIRDKGSKKADTSWSTLELCYDERQRKYSRRQHECIARNRPTEAHKDIAKELENLINSDQAAIDRMLKEGTLIESYEDATRSDEYAWINAYFVIEDLIKKTDLINKSRLKKATIKDEYGLFEYCKSLEDENAENH